MKLSIVMMVKNQSKYLDECLRSLQPVREKIDSELIIVDTGSEDDTVEIAKRYTDKVYFHEWTGNFAEMRNISISYAKGEWVFIIDGDEVLESPNNIIQFFRIKEYRKFNSAAVTIRNFTRDDGSSFADMLMPRLFRKDYNFGYNGAIHEQPRLKGPLCNLNVTLFHYGYIATDENLMKYKFNRNVEILRKELDKDPDNSYYWFQLSQSYTAYNQLDNALEAIQKAYRIIKDKKYELDKHMYVYVHMAFVLFKSDKFNELERICEESIEVKDGYIDIYYFLGKAKMYLKKDSEAVKCYTKYLDIFEHPHKYSGKSDLSVTHHTICAVEDVYLDLTVLYSNAKDHERALRYATMIKSKNIMAYVFPHIIKLFIETGNFDGLGKYYHKNIRGENKDLSDEFISCLEKSLSSEIDQDDAVEIMKVFSKGEEKYATLNQIRLTESLKLRPELLEKIKSWDFSQLPDFYGDSIYHLIKQSLPIIDYFVSMHQGYLEGYAKYIMTHHSDAGELIFEYIQNVLPNPENLYELSVCRILERNALIFGNLNKDQYELLFSRYITNGICLVRGIYRDEIIKNEEIFNVANREDAFLIYMYLANAKKGYEQATYVRYLRKALKTYPEMKKGIELLLDDIKVEDSKEKNLNDYKRIFKENIKKHVESGELALSLQLINEYKNLVGEDIDIYSIEAVIAMMEGRLDDAENSLKEGIRLNEDNFDILYNLAYLYMLKDEKRNAFVYYSKAYKALKDSKIKDEIATTLEQLKNEIGFDEISYETGINQAGS